MMEKRREPAAMPPANVESPASEPPTSRRRAGAQKRKASSLGASNSSSTPSKRITREKASLVHTPNHNGPLTRARQVPSNLYSASSAASAGGVAVPDSAAKMSEQGASTVAPVGDSVALTEELIKERQREALEAAFEAEYEAIRSRGTNAHVVPNHCGWFSWTNIHPIEERTLPSFFNGKTANRTPDIYMEIRNSIMKKFHVNPNVQIELKDLSKLDAGDFDSRQEVMEFLDYWGLINFHPNPSTDSAVADASDDGPVEMSPLLEKVYRFENLQVSQPVVPKTNLMTPSTPSGLFPESAIVEELLRPEGPGVQYHCNSCSADCSRKRYHCQTQADFDLCSDCFNNGKFSSEMSSSDFILMEPAEVPGVSGGKWTDQETLLLLEALELFKENWNEIAEHVATKTKAQCILHFVQMPIEDSFFDCDDTIEATSKGSPDPSETNNDSSIIKDSSEMDNQTPGGDGQELNPSDEALKNKDSHEGKVNEETSKVEDAGRSKIGESSKAKDSSEVKLGQEAGENCALKALREAFEAVGYSSGLEGPLSFAEVGNPAMALAIFLARLVGSDVATASARSSLKSIMGSSPGIQLAARHSFLVEDSPDEKKEPEISKWDSQEDRPQKNQNEINDKSTSVLNDGDLTNDQNDKKSESGALEEKRPLVSTSEESCGKSDSLKEREIRSNHDNLKNGNDSSISELPKDELTNITKESDATASKVEVPTRSVGSGEGIAYEVPSNNAKKVNVLDVSESLQSGRDGSLQLGTSNSVGEHQLQRSETPNIRVTFDSDPSGNINSEKTISTKPDGEALLQNESMDVDTVTDALPSLKNGSQTLVSPELSQCTDSEKEAKVVHDSLSLEKNEPAQPITSSSGADDGTAENGKNSEHGCAERKHDQEHEKVKRAAVSALAAAAVKAKLLAVQEEDQIQEIATVLIEKQLFKLETKLAFFNEMENVVMRVREHLDRSRQKLYHERAQIIASRLGLPASSRLGPQSLPTNRVPMNMVNSVPRPPMSMTPQRLTAPRPIGTMTPTLLSSLVSASGAGNSIQPVGHEKNSSAGTN